MIDLPNQPIPLTPEQQRIKICIECVEITQDPIPHCQACDKPISLLTSDMQEACPLNKW